MLLLALLAVIQFCSIVDFVLPMPLGPQLMKEFGVGPTGFGVMVAAYSIAAALVSLLGSVSLDRFDRKRALISLFGAFSLGTLICALAPSFPVLLLGRAVAGGASGVLNGCLFAIIGDEFAKEKRGRATAAVMVGFSLATVVGIPASIWIFGRYGWRMDFTILAGAGFMICAVIALTVRLKAARSAGKPLKAAMRELTSGPARDALWLTVFMGLSGFAVLPYVSSYAVQNLGVGNEDLMRIYLIGGVASLVVSGIVGVVADFVGVTRIFPAYAFLVVIPCWFVTHLETHSIPVIATVVSIFMAGIAGRIVASMVLLNAVIGEDLRAGFLSLNISFQQLAMGMASMLTGWILVKRVDGSLEHFGRAGVISVGFGMIAVAISLRLVRRIRA